VWRWADVKMRRCEDEKMWRWEEEKMWRSEDVKMRRSEDEKMWRWEDLKMRRCEDEKTWRWEDVKMRRCEDEKMWRWEPHYWKNPALRRSREKKHMNTLYLKFVYIRLRLEDSVSQSWLAEITFQNRTPNGQRSQQKQLGVCESHVRVKMWNRSKRGTTSRIVFQHSNGGKHRKTTSIN
jgi:hypothetical protein